MFEHSLISNRADWVNSTYLNDDSDAVAAYFGAIRTSMNVDYALEAAKYAAAPGLSAETKRRLDLLRILFGKQPRQRRARRRNSMISRHGSSPPMARGRERSRASRSMAATLRSRWGTTATPKN